MRKLKRAVLLAGSVGAVYLFFRFLLFLILPILVAWMVGKLLHPVVRFLRSVCHLPKWCSVFLVLLLFVGGLGIVIFGIGNGLVQQLASLLSNFPEYERMVQGKIENLCNACDGIFCVGEGVSKNYMYQQFAKMGNNLHNSIGDLPASVWNCCKYFTHIIAVVGIMLFLVGIYLWDREGVERQFRSLSFAKEMQDILKPLTTVGFAYVKAQGIIMCIVATVCFVGFFLAGSSYALLFAILVAVLDAFPVLGSGLILVPAAIIEGVNDQWRDCVLLLATFGICQAVRQILEPKIMGKSLGIHPFVFLSAMYVGVQLFGVCGVFLGPIGLVLVQSIVRNCQKSDDTEGTI